MMKEWTFNRHQISDEEVDEVFKLIKKKMDFRLQEKGRGILVTRHEIYGIIAEEFTSELTDALRDNDRTQFREELVDIAVACIIGIASMDSRKMDW
jgi:hypothetical protein